MWHVTSDTQGVVKIFSKCQGPSSNNLDLKIWRKMMPEWGSHKGVCRTALAVLQPICSCPKLSDWQYVSSCVLAPLGAECHKKKYTGMDMATYRLNRPSRALKAKVVKSHDCTKFSRICTKIRLLRVKLLKRHYFLWCWHNLTKF